MSASTHSQACVQPVPVDMITAVANINQDYPGSCGRSGRMGFAPHPMRTGC